jgi:hemerythrin-like metal-binding protein
MSAFTPSPGPGRECPAVDREHDIIVKTMAGLHNAVLEGRGGAVIAPLLDLLARFCAEHFSNEEGLMRDYAYPDVEKHAAAHDRFLRRILQLQGLAHEAVTPTIVETMELLTMLAEHTDRYDREAVYCIQEGIRQREGVGEERARAIACAAV